MNFIELYNSFINKSDLEWLIEHKLVSEEKECPLCSQPMKLQISRKTYRCNKRTCRIEESVFKGTFFFNSHLSVRTIMLLFYGIVYGMSSEMLEREVGVSNITVASFKKLFRQLIQTLFEYRNDSWIGGYGRIVQIDEMVVGKRKYNVGRMPATNNQRWFIGGIDTVSNEVFYTFIENRNRNTLYNAIMSHVRLGSIIHTDSWSGYNKIDQTFEHHTVNHSTNFVENGIHTQNIEAINGAVRRLLRKNGTNSGNKDLQFVEYMWRKKNIGKKDNLFEQFLSDLVFLID
jgi:IS1 family transposase